MKLTPTQHRVDAKIAQASPAAQPVMSHLRKLIHHAIPDVEEAIRWSQPFFLYKGHILCAMGGFKQHTNFGFWSREMRSFLAEQGLIAENSMQTFGKLSSLEDLPPDKTLLTYLRRAAQFIDEGHYTSPMEGRTAAPKAAPEVPSQLAAALSRNKTAAAAFKKFSPACQREYTDWIAEAKRPDTRDKRITTAIEWIAEGKHRNWKYQNC